MRPRKIAGTFKGKQTRRDPENRQWFFNWTQMKCFKLFWFYSTGFSSTFAPLVKSASFSFTQRLSNACIRFYTFWFSITRDALLFSSRAYAYETEVNIFTTLFFNKGERIYSKHL
jgi:hypothetical protein